MFNRIKQLKILTRFMAPYVLISIITGCSSVSNVRPDETTPNFQSTLTVMSFNIRRGCGREDLGSASRTFFASCTKNYDEIIAAIKSADPDVVGLQEVRPGQTEIIAKALDMNYSYSTHNGSGYGRDFGNAVLSKFKILESQSIGIGGSSGRNRSMVSATAIVNDMPIAFVSVHTDHRLHSYNSVNRILHSVDSRSVPIVLIGDFNMHPSDPRVSLLKESAGFIDSAREAEKQGQLLGTWAAPHGARIDYVFIQSEYFNVLGSALVAEEHHQASDHLAYYTTIESNLWARALAETGGDETKTKARYIELRANQLHSENVGSVSGNFNLTGTYQSDQIKGGPYFIFSNRGKLTISLVQKGSRVKGEFTSGLSGAISGTVVGNTIKFSWTTRSCGDGEGEWLASPDGSILEGTWVCHTHKTKNIWTFRKL